jgi:hypothetical protein
MFPGYKLVAMLLHQFAAMGEEECRLLRGMGGIYRVVCSVLSVNPSGNNVGGAHLRDSVGTVLNNLPLFFLYLNCLCVYRSGVIACEWFHCADFING